MTSINDTDLGWSAVFQAQLSLDEITSTLPVRVTAVTRDALDGISRQGPRHLSLPPDVSAGDIAVGDWVLADPESGRLVRLLDRQSLLKRRAAGTGRQEQLIAANLDTLFIVSSCNADFNVARLERYLVLAAEAQVTPVIVLTKADQGDAAAYLREVARFAPNVAAEALDARDPQAAIRLADWLGRGRTGAFLGSSGVGKSTLLNAMTGRSETTAEMRADDAKGRHTTTARGMFAGPGGSWLIDTPGMRALRMADVSDGIDRVFADIGALASECRFSDCGHDSEPGCAVQAAIAAGDLDPERLRRWHKLALEEAHNSASLAEARAHDRALQKQYKQGKARRRWKEDF